MVTNPSDSSTGNAQFSFTLSVGSAVVPDPDLLSLTAIGLTLLSGL